MVGEPEKRRRKRMKREGEVRIMHMRDVQTRASVFFIMLDNFWLKVYFIGY